MRYPTNRHPLCRLSATAAWLARVGLVAATLAGVGCGGDTVGPPDVDSSDDIAVPNIDAATDFDVPVTHDVPIFDPDVPSLDVDAFDVTSPDIDTFDIAPPETNTDVPDLPDLADVPELQDVHETIGDDTGPPPLHACDPPLAFATPATWVLPRRFVALHVTGGSGAYQFDFTARRSGAVLQHVTGEYVSGPTRGVTDEIAVTDLACAGVATAEVHVVFPLAVEPLSVVLVPGAGFRPRVALGSGAWALDLAPGGTSGASIIDGTPDAEEARFVAGPAEGSETVIVRDLRTGETVAIAVQVRADAGPAYDPPWLFAPPGSSYPSVVRGGSGLLQPTVVTTDGQGVHFDPGPPARWLVDGHGTAVAATTDSFVSGALIQRVKTIDAVGPLAVPSGHLLELWTAAGPGDIDGDGFDDIIGGAGEMHAGAFQSGVVFIWGGAAAGVRTEPARVLGGSSRGENFGAALARGDFDGDGQADLAIGAPRFSEIATNVGRVVVFAGRAGAFFGDMPAGQFAGVRSGDLFGHALAACDFDGDGYDDLAVGAQDSEDTTISPLVVNHGSVAIFRGGPAGLETTPAQVIFGAVPGPDGSWVREVNLRFGRVLEAADLDGDGACELLVGNHEFGGDNGVVWVHRGVVADRGDGAGLVEARATAVWRGTNAGRLGFALAAGDLDGDGLADVVMSEPRRATSGAASNNHGVVHIVRGGAWVADGPATAVSTRAMDATLANTGTLSIDGNDEFGFRVAIGEVTGDGHADLIVAGIADEGTCSGRVNNGGAISVIAGRVDGLPAMPAVAVAGSVANLDRLGSAVAAVGHVDASGQPGVFAVAGRDDTNGPDLGLAMVFKPLVARDLVCAEKTVVEMPALEGGWRGGQAFAVVPDLDGDGWPEMAVGASEGAGPATAGRASQSGLVTVHRGHATGFDATPFQTLSGFRRHSLADRWGAGVATLADFDGDGRTDLAVVGRRDDAVADYGAGTVAAAACRVAMTDPGGVAIFAANNNGGFDAEPMFVHIGSQAGQFMESAVGLDFNGDGRSDLVAAGFGWDRPGGGGGDNAGGFEVILGRERPHGGVTGIVCEPDYISLGFAAADNHGMALAALGDIDGDGCEDLAVGTPGSDRLAANAGAVEIYFGAGAECATVTPRRLVIAGTQASSGIGAAMSAVDVDGDGLRELAIAGTTHRAGSASGPATGGVWVITGEVLADLVALAVERAGNSPPVAVPIDGLTAAGGLITGIDANEQFGVAVALVAAMPGSAVADEPLLAVAMLGSTAGGVATGGIVRVFALDIEGEAVRVRPNPVAIIVGETGPAFSGAPALGALHHPGTGRVVLVGAPESNLVRPFSGAVMMAPIDGTEIMTGGEP